eukprot:scaffold10860_cov182-Amphora_coffeaeformis.AAC.8
MLSHEFDKKIHQMSCTVLMFPAGQYKQEARSLTFWKGEIWNARSIYRIWDSTTATISRVQ